jgi:pimeloyl-ACP methyl ester carboxylesterase
VNRFVAAAVAAGLVAAGAGLAPHVVGAAAPRDSGFVPAPIDFGPCQVQSLIDAGAECGYLTVPMDYARPYGTQIQLAVSRIRATVPADQYQGVMIVDPGGPGSPGFTLSRTGQFVGGGAAASSYDWIGFDARGVGASKPALSCDPGYFNPGRPSYEPGDPQNEQAWLNRVKAYAAACAREGGALLDNLKTTDTVEDLESLRKALGQRQISYYGFSYGTYVGTVYASLHPDRLRRAVLDSNDDPTRIWYPHHLDQEVVIDHNLEAFYGWVATHDSTYHLGGTAALVKQAYNHQLASLTSGTGTFGPAELTDALLAAADAVFFWPDVASGLAALVNNGDSSSLLAFYTDFYGPGDDNGNAIYLATKCTDAAWPSSYASWRKDTVAMARKAPFYAWGNHWNDIPCLFWKAKPGTPVSIDGTRAPGILLIGETFDAPTPFEGSLELRREFPRSALVEGVGGTTHTSSADGMPCTDGAVAAYLLTGALPTRLPGDQSDLKCPPVPQPDPTQAAAADHRTSGPVRTLPRG